MSEGATDDRVPVYNWADIPAVAYGDIPVRGFRGDGVGVAYSELHPGAEMKPPHSHDFEQIFMILQGRVRLHLAEEVHECGPGTVVRIPPGVEHWVEAPRPEDGVAINLDIFAPVREDFAGLTAYQTDRFAAP
ncbi:MAG: cupin domain-containing protein [Alphaproteobacteria bacterium]|nr:cupin domain-containing protein [Alphaproteobacteria bacterium]